MSYWKSQAAELDPALRQHPWAEMLLNAIKEVKPQMFEHLTETGEIDAYAITRVNDALLESKAYQAKGMNPMEADSLALTDLLPQEITEDEAWEVEAALEETAAVLADFLNK